MKKTFRRGVELFRELGRAAGLRNIYRGLVSTAGVGVGEYI